LVSAKVNQWTLLVGALPIAYAISSGTTHGLPLDGRQMEEVFLTSAQSLLAVVLIVELHFSLTEAVLLAALFVVQLIFPSPEVRLSFAVLYLALAAGLVVHSPERRAAFRALLVRSD
jgi:cation:H+ antiporter